MYLIEEDKIRNAFKQKDLNLFTLVDTADEAVAAIDRFYRNYLLSPNY
ncbi:hypothetical protein [Cyclobacterium jeungdonense]|nr:hypothetical protein [Cyclobacterium jeungdonense]